MEKQYSGIKGWSEDDRPREKLMKKGVQALSDAELIAILLGSGTRELSAVDLSRNILASASNNINELAKCGIKDLTKIKGIGEAKAITIISALELGRRRKQHVILEKPTVKSSSDAYNLFLPYLSDLQHEEFWVAYFKRSNQFIECMKLSQGGVSGTVVDNRLIIKKALEITASSLILAHNHPSGNLQASAEDERITLKIKEAAALFDIKVLDHIIIGENAYFSFADSGKLV